MVQWRKTESKRYMGRITVLAFLPWDWSFSIVFREKNSRYSVAMASWTTFETLRSKECPAANGSVQSKSSFRF